MSDVAAYRAAYYQMWRRYNPPTTAPLVGTQRRLQALAALGWPMRALTERDPTLHTRMLQNYLAGARSRGVYVTTAARVQALYEALSMTPGPSVTTARRAAARGWAPPLAWDDIDDPTAAPDLGAPATGGVHVDDIEWLIRAGGTWDSVATRLHVTVTGVDKALRRAGRHDLIDRLTARTTRAGAA